MSLWARATPLILRLLSLQDVLRVGGGSVEYSHAALEGQLGRGWWGRSRGGGGRGRWSGGLIDVVGVEGGGIDGVELEGWKGVS